MSDFRVKKYGKTLYLTKAGMIAALYAALTIALAPISYGEIQFRVSEALTVLPFFMPEAIPGLFIGCMIANLFSPNIVVLDVVFGSLATLGAALVTASFAKLGSKGKWLAPLPPVLFNAIIVGAVITYSGTQSKDVFATMFLFNALSIGGTELAVTYVFGIPVLYLYQTVLKKMQTHVKKT